MELIGYNLIHTVKLTFCTTGFPRRDAPGHPEQLPLGLRAAAPDGQREERHHRPDRPPGALRAEEP